MIPSSYKTGLLLAVSISFFVCVLLLSYTRRSRHNNRLLALFFFALGYPAFLSFLVTTKLIYYAPHLYRTGIIASMMVVPISYLYIRALTTGRSLTKKDLLHALPALLYVIDYIPFFLLPGEEKMKSLYAGESLGKTIILFKEGMVFPPGFYMLMRYFLIFVYWTLQFLLFKKLLNIRQADFSLENRKLLQWIKIFIACQASFFLPPLTLFGKQFAPYEFVIYFFMIGGVCAISAVSLFFFPEILYGIRGVMLPAPETKEDSKENTPTAKEEPEPVRYLSETRIQEIATAIQEHFTKNRPYLRLQYSLSQLSAELGIPVKFVSAYINEYEKVNFNDFVNKFRVMHCLELFHQGYYKQQKLESLARDCGFNNRNTFTMAFKKVAGQTPSDYIKALEQEEPGASEEFLT